MKLNTDNAQPITNVSALLGTTSFQLPDSYVKNANTHAKPVKTS